MRPILERGKTLLKKLLRLPTEEDWRDHVPAMLRKVLPTDRPLRVIDVGAHDGDFTRALTRHYPLAAALLVEALPHKAEQLRREFPSAPFRVAECAAADREGSVEFEMNSFEETSSLLKIRRDLPELASLSTLVAQTLRVPARRLDEIAADFGEIDLLKIDVQGAELQVLVAAQAVLARTRFVWIEVSFKPLYENSATFFEVHALLDAAGFGLAGMQPAFRGPSGEMLQADALYLKR